MYVWIVNAKNGNRSHKNEKKKERSDRKTHTRAQMSSTRIKQVHFIYIYKTCVTSLQALLHYLVRVFTLSLNTF